MFPIQWITRDEWMKLPKPECLHEIPKDITFALPLEEIRARIGSMNPLFTPKEDEDFPGPVERWYGSFSGKGFTLTYHYSAPVSDQVVVSHWETIEFSCRLEEALQAWRNPFPV